MIEKTVDVVKKVGALIREEFDKFDSSVVEHKGFNDLVSYVDKQAEEKLVSGLSGVKEGAGFLVEENSVDLKNEKSYWIIDPLDGTTNFVHGLPVFAISVALVVEGELEIGVVYEINRDECFYAEVGKGAFMNGKPIKVSDKNELGDSLLATGFPYYQFGKMDKYLLILNDFMKQTHGLRRMGAAAVDLAYVACGRFEGFFEYNLQPWDVAGGALIVKEAGGIVSDFNAGNKYLFDGEIIAACAVHEDMQKVISNRW